MKTSPLSSPGFSWLYQLSTQASDGVLQPQDLLQDDDDGTGGADDGDDNVDDDDEEERRINPKQKTQRPR